MSGDACACARAADMYATIPEAATLDSVAELVRALPLTTQPEVLGLHDNATISRDSGEATVLLDALLLTQPRVSGGAKGGGATPEAIVDALAGDLFARLSADFDVMAARERFPVTYEESMNTVRARASACGCRVAAPACPCAAVCSRVELAAPGARARARVLQQATARHSLVPVRPAVSALARFGACWWLRVRDAGGAHSSAISGVVVMSASLDLVFTALFNGKVPELWSQSSYPSTKPLMSYFEDLLARVRFYASWTASGPPNAFWLPGMFNAQSFLTGVLQNCAGPARARPCALSWCEPVCVTRARTRRRRSQVPHPDRHDRVWLRSAAGGQRGCRPARVRAAGGRRAGLRHVHRGARRPLPGRGRVARRARLTRRRRSRAAQGARWDAAAMRIEDSAPHALFSLCPVLHLRPNPRPRGPPAAAAGPPYSYNCPLYRTSARHGTLSTTGHSTNFVMYVSLPASAPPTHWTRRGTALLMALSN